MPQARTCAPRSLHAHGLHRPTRLPHHSPLSCRRPTQERPLRRLQHSKFSFVPLAILSLAFSVAHADTKPHLFQSPALKGDLIAFGYAGDLWTVPRNGGRAVRLTNGVGLESMPIFSPDGSTIAVTGDYDGNTDVFTIPAIGGIPRRVTYHPAPDAAVAWTPDGKRILFRSTRTA